MKELSTQEAQKILGNITIPPRPSLVTAVMEERMRPEPDIARITKLIASDVGLSAAVLKTVNSPLYGLRQRAASIEQAVFLLGMTNISALVMGLALRKQVQPGLERFWDTASRTALVASFLAKSLNLSNQEEAHLYGLFNNCSLPLMMQRFPDYKETLRIANRDTTRAFTAVEDERHGTNHAAVGSLLATNWQLPDTLRNAIRYHHDLDIFTSARPFEELNLIAAGILAEHIEQTYTISHSATATRAEADAEWEKLDAAALSHLMIDLATFTSLQREAHELLAESGL